MRFKLRKILMAALGIHLVFIFCFTVMYLSTREGAVLPIAAKKTFKVQQYENRTPATSFVETSDLFEYTVNASGNCAGLLYKGYLNRKDAWSPVDDGGQSYVFSAYHDEMYPSRITIFGAKTSLRESYLCQLWYRSTDKETISVIEVAASAHLYSEGHGRKYTACIFSCNLPNETVPLRVSVVNKKCKQPQHLLPVKEIEKKPYIRQFTVCTTPLNFRYGRAYELIEWIELNMILGADYFVFYNYSSASNVAQVLHHYSNRGLAEVVQWQLPMGVNKWPRTNDAVEIHYFGQLAALNECLMRNKGQSQYIVFQDLDEFIIPHSENSTTWMQMMKELPTSDTYIFKNSFFRKEWKDSDYNFTNRQLADKYRLVTLLKTERENKIFPLRQRSKYIVRSNGVDAVGVHDVSAKHVFGVPPNVGLLHHYRNWEQYNDQQTRVKDDMVVKKYKDILIDNVNKTWSTLNNVKMDIPIT